MYPLTPQQKCIIWNPSSRADSTSSQRAAVASHPVRFISWRSTNQWEKYPATWTAIISSRFLAFPEPGQNLSSKLLFQKTASLILSEHIQKTWMQMVTCWFYMLIWECNCLKGSQKKKTLSTSEAAVSSPSNLSIAIQFAPRQSGCVRIVEAITVYGSEIPKNHWKRRRNHAILVGESTWVAGFLNHQQCLQRGYDPQKFSWSLRWGIARSPQKKLDRLLNVCIYKYIHT